MGHLRLGRLPKTRRWTEVINLLGDPALDPPSLAAAVISAADNRLRQLANDEGLGYSFWLLTRIAWAARGPGFVEDLARLGINVNSNTSSLQLIAQVADRVTVELARTSAEGDFAGLGSLALRSALTDTVGQQGASLFGSPLEDLQSSFREYSTQAQFGRLSHRFFGNFFARVLRSYVDRELGNHVGTSPGLSNLNQSRQFLDALDLHASQSARIVEDFAGGWYSRHNWESQGAISQDETQRFMAYALRKLRSELKQSVAAA
ncbi:MAG: hypothetical protein O2913_08905 [Chloroflexi bacterium]|nr:hypothetical protein [Chloroflexota bacterium]